jgi:hypothetical protein
MKKQAELKKMGPLKVAALNGLTLSRLPRHQGGKEKPETSNDERVGTGIVLDWCCPFNTVC